MNRAFVAVQQVNIDGTLIDETEIYTLLPELRNKIVNTHRLAEQAKTASDSKNVNLRIHYEPQVYDGYVITVQEQETRPEGDATFLLKNLAIDAGEDLPEGMEELEAISTHYAGQEVGMTELNTAVNDVTRYYRQHGYPAATAYLPPQESEDNTIHIGVEPGRYGKIEIENQSHVKTQILEGLSHGFSPGEVIHGKELESSIYNIIGLGGVKAAGLLRPGEKQGETNLTIRVEDTKRDSYILYSENYGSKTSGRYRYGFLAHWYELTGLGDHLFVNGLLSNNQQRNYGMRYELLTGHSGTKLGIGISRTDYELGSHLSSLGATGLSNTYSIFGTTPFWRTGDAGVGLSYGWEYRDMKDEIRSIDYVVKKHTNTFHVGINGFQRQKKTAISYDLTAYLGNMTGDSARVGDIPLEVAPEGSYIKGVLNLNLLQTFTPHWDMLFRFQGQAAGNNLDSSEKIYLGGANGVRAYPQGEGSGDTGCQATAELRYHTKVPGLVLSTYFDIGHVKYMHDGTIPGGTTLKGWGIGLSWTRENDFFARLDYARRIGLAKDATDDAHAKDRLWFMIGKVF